MSTLTVLKEKEQEAQSMFDAGVHIGHQKARSHPKMKQHVLTTRSGVQIINLENTYAYLGEALEYIYKSISEGKKMVLVGTTPAACQAVEEVGKECEVPYVNTRWIGGTLSNFPTILKGIESMLDLEQKKKTGELEKYTKKEKMMLSQKLERLQEKYSGLRTLKSVPEILFVVDAKKHKIAVHEAGTKHITVVALVDTDTNPKGVKYVIPSNDNSINSVRYILSKVKETVLVAKKEAKQKVQEQQQQAKEKKHN
jgi:small subunit ribosomal protein S2